MGEDISIAVVAVFQAIAYTVCVGIATPRKVGGRCGDVGVGKVGGFSVVRVVEGDSVARNADIVD